MSMRENKFTHFQPEGVLIPKTERGEMPEPSTQVVVGADGRIAFAGTPDEVAQWVRSRRDEGANIEVQRGGVLLPGMRDSHYHPALYSMLEIIDPVDVSSADSPWE